MRTKLRILIFLLISQIFLLSCEDDFRNISEVASVKKGFTYEILQQRGNFTLFLQAVKMAGYEELIEGKGLSTFFAPSDEAFQKYLKENGYAGIEDINVEDLRILIGLHIVKYSYNLEQFLNFQPTFSGEQMLPGICYKHRTIVRSEIGEMYDASLKKKVKVFNREKYLPVFTINMFQSAGLDETESNYKYFYPHSQWSTNSEVVHPANAQVLESAIPTDNGYLYIIDQVINPIRTVYNVLEDPKMNYSIVKKLFDRFPGFRYDQDLSKKYANPGDSLYLFYAMPSRNYPLLDIGSEWTANSEDWKLLTSLSYNLVAPSDAAMQTYFKEYWGDQTDVSDEYRYKDFDDLDRLSAYYLLANHMIRVSGMLFPEMIRKGLKDSWGGNYSFNVDEDVEHKEVCGNGAFYGINKVQPPTVFYTATRPVFQSKRYVTFSYMLMKSGLVQTLSNQDLKVTLLLPSDELLAKQGYSVDRSSFVDFSSCKITKSGTEMNAAALESFIKNHIITQVIEEEDLNNENPVWFETEKKDVFLKIGNGIIEQENTKPVGLGFERFNRDGHYGDWRAYEVNTVFEVPKNLMSTITNTYLDKWKTEILRDGKSSYWPGGTGRMSMFKNRGIIFCTGPKEDVVRETNGIPKADKNLMDAWVQKHVVLPEDNSALRLLDFIQGSVFDLKLKTMFLNFSITINKMKELEDGDLNLQHGRYELEVELPDGRIVHAYGPNFAEECLYFILPGKENFFVK